MADMQTNDGITVQSPTIAPQPPALPVPIPRPVPSQLSWLSVAGPQVLQIVALICLTVLVLVRDGVDISSVVGWLSIIAAGNAVTAGAVGVTHSIQSARVQQSSIQASRTEGTAGNGKA